MSRQERHSQISFADKILLNKLDLVSRNVSDQPEWAESEESESGHPQNDIPFDYTLVN
jgi:G3E family GTPase